MKKAEVGVGVVLIAVTSVNRKGCHLQPAPLNPQMNDLRPYRHTSVLLMAALAGGEAES